jgi:hypothetical protein
VLLLLLISSFPSRLQHQPWPLYCTTNVTSFSSFGFSIFKNPSNTDKSQLLHQQTAGLCISILLISDPMHSRPPPCKVLLQPLFVLETLQQASDENNTPYTCVYVLLRGYSCCSSCDHWSIPPLSGSLESAPKRRYCNPLQVQQLTSTTS